MSDFRAIGGVSSTLQRLLADRMELPDGTLEVPPITIGPPPFSSTDNNPTDEHQRVNLFLYRVSEHGNLQNQEIPGQGSSGAFGRPPLSLKLHYLLSAYGNTKSSRDSTIFDDTLAHLLLGSAMRVLHDVPIITNRLTTVRAPSGLPVLDLSLRDGYEQIKLSLEPLTLEDITKIWTSLSLRMRLAAPYVVSVVQIESRRQRRFPRPVGQPASAVTPPLPGDAPTPGPMVYALPIQTPTITDVRVRRVGESVEQPFAYARIGDTLVLRGTSLAAPLTSVVFGDLMVPATVAGPDRVEALIPDDSIPGVGPIPVDQQLQSGVRTVRVVVRDPSLPGSSFSSNEAPFMLVPLVDTAALSFGSGPPRQLTIQGNRLIGPTPGGETLMGRSHVDHRAYLSATPKQIVVPIPDTLPARGVHLILGGSLPDPVPVGSGPYSLDIKIAGITHTISDTITNYFTGLQGNSIPRSSVAAILTSLIHDSTPETSGTPESDLVRAWFRETRVDLWKDRLVVVPGRLSNGVVISSKAGNFATALGLNAVQPPGTDSALLSGALASPPVLSAPEPRVSLSVGGKPSIIVPVGPASSLAALAEGLQSAINGSGGPAEYSKAQVVVSGDQLLVIPGATGDVRFAAAPGDDLTVSQLQLQARFAVRVRVNGAESIDLAAVELPPP
jgi:hypothetical protein